jgi:iron(III) transport system substrate-binding protein
MKALYRQALAAGEDRVVIYSCTGDTEWQPLWRAFEAAFPGVDVVYSHISPSQVMIRIDSETVTGRRFGDLYMPPVNVAEDIADKGYFQPFSPVSAERLDPRWRDPQGLVDYPFAKVFGLAYNTQAVARGAVPQRIDDILEPRWRKRYTYIKPATMNGATDIALTNLAAAGAVSRRQLESLRDNGAYSGIEAGVTYVSQGRQDIQLWAYLPTVLRQHELGAPVAITFPPDFSTLAPFGVAISRNVVHPNAARLMKAWLFTPRAQAILAQGVGMYATAPDAPLPPFLPPSTPTAGPRQGLPPRALQVALADGRNDLKSIFDAKVKP